MKLRISTVTLTLIVGIAIVVSSMALPSTIRAQGDPARPQGWEEYSHGNDTDPVYETVLPQDEVNTVTITIDPANWQAMLEDMTALYGEFGTRSGMGGFGGGNPPGQNQDGAGGFVPGPPPGGGGPGGFGGDIFGSGENPIWVTADIQFEDQVWTKVGIRWKGNSSLRSAWDSGIWKLGFKLDFDQFEDDYPEIKNQRFFGFKKLSFSSNWNDSSLLREKVTADVFREAGVPAAQTAFYAVYVDYGEGATYFGLYTAVEEIEDTVIKTQFEDNSGNLYKPEGNGATFAAGTFTEASFDKETNAGDADYSDILALFEALHADTRTSDPAAWRAGLEAIFDVDGFIRWLAINTVVQNWDTYGRMPHNYFLYNDPSTGLLTWIPWDHNLAMAADMGGMGRGGRGGPGGVMAAAALDQSGVGSSWPLIRFLIDDPVYHDRYVKNVDETSKTAFEPTKMTETFTRLHTMIAPYVVGEYREQAGYTFVSSEAAFNNALTQLITHVNQRYTAAQDYIASQTTK